MKINIREGAISRRNSFQKLQHFIFSGIIYLFSLILFIYLFYYAIIIQEYYGYGLIIMALFITSFAYFGYGFVMSAGWYAIPLIKFKNIKINHHFIFLPWHKGIFKSKIYKIPLENVSIIKYSEYQIKLNDYKGSKYLLFFYPLLLPGFNKIHFLLKGCIILACNNRIYYYPKKILSHNYRNIDQYINNLIDK